MQAEPLTKHRGFVIAQDSPWVGRDFLKDTGKKKSKERYWHSIRDESLDTLSSSLGLVQEPRSVFIVPDALSWRTYLRLFKYVTALTGNKPPELETAAWVLLESVVEEMDYRNQSAVVSSANSTRGTREMAAPQERSTLQKLVMEGNVLPFCDLSIRSVPSQDEWSWLDYEALTIESRSRYALLRAARCLHDMQENVKEVVLLVDDLDNGEWHGLRADEGVSIVDTDSFFQKLGSNSHTDQISQLIRTCRDDYRKRNCFEPVTHEGTLDREQSQEYWPENRVREGLNKKELIRGRLAFTKENPKEGFVRADGKHWFIDAREDHHNRAIHQDVVILQPLAEEEWGRPVGKHRLVFAKDDDDANNITKDYSVSYPTFPSARVVAIETMSRRTYVATMVDVPIVDESAAIVVPMDIRIPKIRLPTKVWHQFVGKRLLVEVDGWELGSSYPHGRVNEILGDIGDVETEIKCLLCENQVRLQPFSVAARACLPENGANWTIPPSEQENRRDLRGTHRVFSVDPVGCQDIDDTMSVRYLASGDVEVAVNIADVTHFVPLDSALDREARIRGTTFYLVDRRFDMLPSLLSSNLCSLHGQTDRLAVSVIWTLSRDLETVKSTWYGRTIIHNVAAMTYEQAANILKGRDPEKAGEEPPPPLTAGAPVEKHLIPALKKDLEVLTTLARKRRKIREDIGGAVDLSSGDVGGELKFTLLDGKPVAVQPKQPLEVHSTIAELMIWANTSVATKIHNRFPGSALLRVHQDVAEDRFDDLKEMLVAGNLELDGKSNMELAESLKKAESKSVPVVSALFRSLATRAMSEALYVSTGDTKEGQHLSHYGLGLSLYTHFTSPIRRYADVLVHHQLIASLVEPPKYESHPTLSQATVVLPQSTVLSMLEADSSETNVKNRGEFDIDQEAANTEVDLILGTSDLKDTHSTTGRLDGRDTVCEVSEGRVSTDLDDLIGGAPTAHLCDEEAETDIDALIGGASTMLLSEGVIGSFAPGENEAGSTLIGETDIDDLIGGATSMLIGEGVSGSSAPGENEGATAVLGTETDIDDLIGGSTTTMLLGEGNGGSSPGENETSKTTTDIDDLIGGATTRLVADDTRASSAPAENESRNFSNGVETATFDDASSIEEGILGGKQGMPASRKAPDTHDALNLTSRDVHLAGAQVSTICERLNLHNRLAKQCSFDCQALFLSLFFKEKVESAQAVVSVLRENGFVAYVPRFDLRLPVFLQSSDGFVQMDPSLLGLPSEAGDDPTVGFARSAFCRRFSREDADLSLTAGGKLEVRVGGTVRMILSPLDVVNVEIFSDGWDQRARVPSPRAHLVHSHRTLTPDLSGLRRENPVEKSSVTWPRTKREPTLFDVVELFRSSPAAPETVKLCEKNSRVENLRGRIVFGEFTNPNTRQAAQLLAQEEAAAEAQPRRNNAIQSATKRDEFSNTRRIEREVTVRQQRLEKQKRETRRAKRQG